MIHYLYLIGGFIILIAGAEVMVRGAAGLALKARISPLIVGLTIVSLGTSAPELFASLQATWQGSPEIAVGNVIGSNIANLGLVLAITCLIFPLPVDRIILRQDWPMMIIASLAFYIFSLDGTISFIDGLIFFITLVFFTGYLVFRSGWNRPLSEDNGIEDGEEFQKVAGKSYRILIALIILGSIGLYYGSEGFLKGAIGLAEKYGIEDHVIGVTVVAFGTSIPELAASGMAAFRKQTQISIGNLIGSNIFNLLGVIGVTSMVHSLPISDTVINWDIFWMLGIALVIFPMMYFGKKFNRIDGVLLLAVYVTYVVMLIV